MFLHRAMIFADEPFAISRPPVPGASGLARCGWNDATLQIDPYQVNNWAMSNWAPDLSRFDGPRYQALVAAIDESIERGELKPGQRLPTRRDLARSLGLEGRATVRLEIDRNGIASDSTLLSSSQVQWACPAIGAVPERASPARPRRHESAQPKARTTTGKPSAKVCKFGCSRYGIYESFRRLADREGFEPSEPREELGGLAIHWFKPLTHLPAGRRLI